MQSEAGTHLLGRRYHLRDLLGRGGMGSVYRAWDHLTGQYVALKRVTQHTDTASFSTSYDIGDFRLALAREFKFLASLRHPHIIEVLDYGFDEHRQPYYTMELLENASTILEAGQKAPFDTQLKLMVQMLQALAYLHRRNILHRDLKPGNVMVTEGGVKLLDFGLSIMRDRVEVDEPSNTTAGTLAYMAPEVLIGNPANPGSDLYALGMLGIEMLTGTHPFNESDIGTLINHILYTPPDLKSTGIHTEVGLVLERLVQKEPVDRYASAQEVITALENAIGESIEHETLATRESFLQAAPLVGRDAELAQLSQALERLRDSSGSICLIVGESGVGKSRLLDELRTLSMVHGTLVIRGETISEGISPFYLWRFALRWIRLVLDLSPQDAALIDALVPTTNPSGEQPQTVNSSYTTPQQIQTRLLHLLQQMIRQINQPLVLIFEDLQWAGSESIDLLAELCKLIHDLPVFIVASTHDYEEVEGNPLLPNASVLHLSRLDGNGISELSAAMIGDAGKQPQVLNLLQRETEGNILFLIEVVRALAEEAGALENIGKATLPESVFAGGIQRIIRRRLDHLPSWTHSALQAAALYGRQIDIRILGELYPDMDVDRWLLACSEATVIEMSEGQWRFNHDRIRHTLLETLTTDEQRVLHQSIAETIEAHYSTRDYARLLVHHWSMAGIEQKERQYLTIAAEQALRTGAYWEAISLFDRGLVLLDDTDSSSQTHIDRIRLQQKQGEAYLGIGDYDQAQAIFEVCLGLARQLQANSDIGSALNSLGSIAHARGQQAQARQYFQNALHTYRNNNDRSGVARALHNLGNVAYDLGEAKLANQLYQQSMSINRKMGAQWGMAGAISNESTASHANTELNDTLEQDAATNKHDLYRDLLSAFEDGQTTRVLRILLDLSQLHIEQGQKEKALELLALMLHHPQLDEARVEDEAEHLAYELQTTLNTQTAQRIWERGKNADFITFIRQLLAAP